MTIQAHFKKGGQVVIVRLIGDVVLFIDPIARQMSTIEGLRISKEGVEREFPDLIGDEEWKQKAIQRFVEKIKSIPTEEERMDWLINELKEMGYEPLFKQEDGFRPVKL